MFVLVRPEETFEFIIVAIGLAAALLLRFEFMNDLFVRFFKLIETAVFIYVI
jgi:hypothetical protein